MFSEADWPSRRSGSQREQRDFAARLLMAITIRLEKVVLAVGPRLNVQSISGCLPAFTTALDRRHETHVVVQACQTLASSPASLTSSCCSNFRSACHPLSSTAQPRPEIHLHCSLLHEIRYDPHPGRMSSASPPPLPGSTAGKTLTPARNVGWVVVRCPPPNLPPVADTGRNTRCRYCRRDLAVGTLKSLYLKRGEKVSQSILAGSWQARWRAYEMLPWAR